jgi:hypothetical protein
LGDGEPGSGAVVIHTYPSAGVYTVVTASNASNAITAETTVIIDGEPVLRPLFAGGVAWLSLIRGANKQT